MSKNTCWSVGQRSTMHRSTQHYALTNAPACVFETPLGLVPKTPFCSMIATIHIYYARKDCIIQKNDFISKYDKTRKETTVAAISKATKRR